MKNFYVTEFKKMEAKIAELTQRLEQYEKKPAAATVDEKPPLEVKPPEKPIEKIPMTEDEKAFFLQAAPDFAPFIELILRIRKMHDNERLDATRQIRNYTLIENRVVAMRTTSEPKNFKFQWAFGENT